LYNVDIINILLQRNKCYALLTILKYSLNWYANYETIIDKLTEVMRKLYNKNIIKILHDAYMYITKTEEFIMLIFIFLLTKRNNCTHAKKSATSKNNNYCTDS